MHLNRPKLYKTKLCKYHQERRCKNGALCEYAHDALEVRPMPNLRKTKLCPRYAQGRCAAGGECKYAHGEVELRATVDFYKTSLCSEWSSGGQCVRGDSCRYAHGPHELRAPGGFHAPGRSVTSPPHSEPAGIAASNRHALAPTNIFKSPLPLPLAQLTVTADPVAAGMPPPGYFARPGLPPYLDYAITCDIPLGDNPSPVLCPEGPPDTQSLQMADGNGVLAGGSLHQELSQEPTERHLITYEQPFLGNDNGRARPGLLPLLVQLAPLVWHLLVELWEIGTQWK